MSGFLDMPNPRQRLHEEMRLVALNLTHLTSRYPVMPVGRSTILIRHDSPVDLILGSHKNAKIPYEEKVQGCVLPRTRLRMPGKTPATADYLGSLEAEMPWAAMSGISASSSAMVDWILLEELRRPHSVVYKPEAAVLLAEDEEKPLASFVSGILGEHCYPTEGYFVRDVCAYLSPWWTAEVEVDGELDGEEVRLDAVLTLRSNDEIVIGVEAKNPHSLGKPLTGLTQAAAYRKANWVGHRRLPIAFCCPGRVPVGREKNFIKDRLKIGLLDFDGSWHMDTPFLGWSETAGVTRYETDT